MFFHAGIIFHFVNKRSFDYRHWNKSDISFATKTQRITFIDTYIIICTCLLTALFMPSVLSNWWDFLEAKRTNVFTPLPMHLRSTVKRTSSTSQDIVGHRWFLRRFRSVAWVEPPCWHDEVLKKRLPLPVAKLDRSRLLRTQSIVGHRWFMYRARSVAWVEPPCWYDGALKKRLPLPVAKYDQSTIKNAGYWGSPLIYIQSLFCSLGRATLLARRSH